MPTSHTVVARYLEAANPTDLNEEVLFREVLRQGPVLTEFPRVSIPHIRRCLDGGLLENTGEKHGRGFKWRLTPAGEQAVRGQHKKALETWKRHLDSFTKTLSGMDLGPGGDAYKVLHEGFDLHWEVEPTKKFRADQAREGGEDWSNDYAWPMEEAAQRYLARHRNVLFEDKYLGVSADTKGYLHVEVTEEGKRDTRFTELQQLLDFRL